VHSSAPGRMHLQPPSLQRSQFPCSSYCQEDSEA
jgi:hypothetical protein